MSAGPPRDSKEIKSLYGLFSYASKYIKDAATLLAPFRELMKISAKFNWTINQDRALEELKKAYTTESMGYFNRNWITELTTDASPTGLGAVLGQYDPQDKNKRHIVLFASRSLSPIERRYAQVEREALAVVWACEKLKMYLIGKEFNLIVDIEAVELIYKNPRSKPLARIERWSLRLLPFNFKIEHQPGEMNIADYFSRNALKEIRFPILIQIREMKLSIT